jgi:uncharacterized protein YjbI with pentapeptide repeats
MDGLAESGEEFETIQGNRYLTLEGFAKLVLNANLKGVHLPFFNPLRLVVVGEEGKGFLFQGTSLTRAVLSHIGIDENGSTVPRIPLQVGFSSSNLNGASLDNAHNCGLYFRDCSMINLNMNGFVSPGVFMFEEIRIIGSDARKLKMVNSRINEGTFTESNLENADFSHSSMSNIGIVECNFKNAKFVNVTFYNVCIRECNLNDADFSHMKVDDSTEEQSFSFINCTFVGTTFHGADLRYSDFENCDLTGIIFGNALFSDEKSEVRFENCTKDGMDFPPLPPSTEWTDEDYAECDNNQMEYEDGVEGDPLFYRRDNVKEDHIWAEPLKRGKEMVVYSMLNRHGKKVKQMCYNRDHVKEDFDRQLKFPKDVRGPLSDYYKDPITQRFFDENGGFAEKYTNEIVTSAGGRRTRKTKKRRRRRRK